jgi:hypothetical protein
MNEYKYIKYQKIYRRQNRAQINNRSRERYWDNHKKALAYYRRYYTKNREKIRARQNQLARLRYRTSKS